MNREIVFRRKHKTVRSADLFFDVVTGETYQILGIGKVAIDLPIWNLPNHIEEKYGPIEQYTGLTDCKGARIWEGDVLTADEYLYKENGERNYDGTVCWDEDTASFFIYLECVNPDKAGISNGMSHNFGDGYTYEVIGNIHEEENK